MKKRIILHIGPHKTASSYIQNSLVQNINILNKNNIDYPKNGFSGQGHHILADLLFKKQYDSAKKIIKDILSFNYNTIIISSEDFDKLDFEDITMLHSLLKSCLVEIIYVKRSIREVMISHWQEMIKHGNTYTWSEYFFQNLNNPFDSRIINSCKVLDIYSDIFNDNIHIINYDEIKKMNDDILRPFLKIVGIEYKDMNVKQKYINKSLNYDDIEIMRLLNCMRDNPLNLGCLNCVVNTDIYEIYFSSILTNIVYETEIKLLKEKINKHMYNFNFQNSVILDQLEKTFFDKYLDYIVNSNNKNNKVLWNENVNIKLPTNKWVAERGVCDILTMLYDKVF